MAIILLTILFILQELLKRVLSSKYKLTSVPIAIDFLIRHGVINSDNELNIPAVQELLHVPLHVVYSQWPVLRRLPSPPHTPTLDSPPPSISSSPISSHMETTPINIPNKLSTHSDEME